MRARFTEGDVEVIVLVNNTLTNRVIKGLRSIIGMNGDVQNLFSAFTARFAVVVAHLERGGLFNSGHVMSIFV